MKRWLLSAVAGFAATAPMSLVMLALQRRLPWNERYALPPRQITRCLSQSVTQRLALPKPSRPQQDVLTATGHFIYGTAAGSLYPVIASRLDALGLKNAPLIKGMVFGLGVWLVSYLGWLPAMGILRSAREHPARRNGLMIVAHLVWGATLGWLEARWNEENAQPDV